MLLYELSRFGYHDVARFAGLAAIWRSWVRYVYKDRMRVLFLDLPLMKRYNKPCEEMILREKDQGVGGHGT